MSSTTNWFVRKGGKTYGPLTPKQLKQFARDEKINRDTQVRLGTDGTWVPAGKVKGLFQDVSEPAKPQLQSAPTAETKPVQPSGPLPIPAEPVPSQRASAQMPCPFCGELISNTAIKCRYCNEFLDGRQPYSQRPPLESGHVAQAPSVNVHMPKRTSSLGIVSLILGIVAFAICWIPFIGVLTIPLSALGVLLAAIGLLIAFFRGGSGIGWPIGGGAVSGLALAIGMAQIAAIGAAATAIVQTSKQANRTQQEVVTAGGSGHATRATSDDPSGASETAGQIASDVSEWVSAENAVRQGEIEVRVTRVLMGKISLRSGFDDRETTSQNDLLAIHIAITNHSKSRKIEYQSLLGRDVAFTRDYATLQDNFGNSYERISFGFSSEIVGHTESDSIYPEETLGDVLVFELPVDTVKYLNLELPAKNFGGEGMLRLRIPSEMIQRR